MAVQNGKGWCYSLGDLKETPMRMLENLIFVLHVRQTPINISRAESELQEFDLLTYFMSSWTDTRSQIIISIIWRYSKQLQEKGNLTTFIS